MQQQQQPTWHRQLDDQQWTDRLVFLLKKSAPLADDEIDNCELDDDPAEISVDDGGGSRSAVRIMMRTGAQHDVYFGVIPKNGDDGPYGASKWVFMEFPYQHGRSVMRYAICMNRGTTTAAANNRFGLLLGVIVDEKMRDISRQPDAAEQTDFANWTFVTSSTPIPVAIRSQVKRWHAMMKNRLTQNRRECDDERHHIHQRQLQRQQWDQHYGDNRHDDDDADDADADDNADKDDGKDSSRGGSSNRNLAAESHNGGEWSNNSATAAAADAAIADEADWSIDSGGTKRSSRDNSDNSSEKSARNPKLQRRQHLEEQCKQSTTTPPPTTTSNNGRYTWQLARLHHASAGDNTIVPILCTPDANLWKQQACLLTDLHRKTDTEQVAIPMMDAWSSTTAAVDATTTQHHYIALAPCQCTLGDYLMRHLDSRHRLERIIEASLELARALDRRQLLHGNISVDTIVLVSSSGSGDTGANTEKKRGRRHLFLIDWCGAVQYPIVEHASNEWRMKRNTLRLGWTGIVGGYPAMLSDTLPLNELQCRASISEFLQQPACQKHQQVRALFKEDGAAALHHPSAIRRHYDMLKQQCRIAAAENTDNEATLRDDLQVLRDMRRQSLDDSRCVGGVYTIAELQRNLKQGSI
jgi:hypothetical protein